VKRLFFLLIVLLQTPPALAQTLSPDTEVVQTVTASQNGVALPSSTGQAVTYATCQQVIANNLTVAPRLGYTVNTAAGTFTDPQTGITIQQGCTPAAPFYIPAPNRPGGSIPSFVAVPCPMQGPGTDVWYIIGQSNAGNNGDGRYTAGAGVFMYAGNGQCYPASDPIVGTDGAGAGPWARLADLMLGQSGLNGNKIANIVIIDRAVGGSSVANWAQGGIFNAKITASLNDALANGYTPTRLVWVQGESDVDMPPATYINDFFSMLQTIRQLGLTAPIWVATTTICNLRTSADPHDQDVINRTPDSYISIEAGRQSLRATQQYLGHANINFHEGANLDSLDIGLRRDGCHLGSYGLDQEAQLWLQAFTQQ